MAYQNGTATSPTDLLQKLATFLVANGWTQDQSAVDGAGWRLHAHKGAVYVNLRAAVNEGLVSLFDDYYTYPWSGIAIYLGDGYSSGATWKNQSGGPKNATNTTRTQGSGTRLPQGAISGYHFFADTTGDNIVVVIEKSAGVFTHFGWGTSLQKMGAWTGGPYFFAANGIYCMSQDPTGAQPGAALSAECPGTNGDPVSTIYPVTYVRIDVDSFTGKWVGIGTNTAVGQGYTGKIGYSCVPANEMAINSGAPSYIGFMKRLTGQMTGQSLLLPVRFLVTRDTGGKSFIGSLPTVFLCNACAKGFTPATLYQWGTDSYRVFPGPTTFPHHGFAVKQV